MGARHVREQFGLSAVSRPQEIYVYGPTSMTVEQINNTTGTVTYLHHDQAGSTRLLTGSTGAVTGKCTYNAYGTPTCEGTTTTPLGYDGQYTSSDTGLIYLRKRTYDPATGQFLSIDPDVGLTRAPYTYTLDNPLNFADPNGLTTVGTCIHVGGLFGEVVGYQGQTSPRPFCRAQRTLTRTWSGPF